MSWVFNGFELSISFQLRPIPTVDIQGILLGYLIKYTLMEESNNTRMTVLRPEATNGTLTNLKEGSYRIAAAEFTRKGVGPYHTYNISCKFIDYELMFHCNSKIACVLALLSMTRQCLSWISRNSMILLTILGVLEGIKLQTHGHQPANRLLSGKWGEKKFCERSEPRRGWGGGACSHSVHSFNLIPPIRPLAINLSLKCQ